MDNLLGTVDKIIPLIGEKNMPVLVVTADKVINLSGTIVKTVSLTGEFGLGYVSRQWVLLSGFWNDTGFWEDAQNWNDGV